MKLGGYRSDGTMRVLIPGGMTVLLRGEHASPPIDDKVADAYGPWTEPAVSLTWQERQNLGKQLDRAHTVAVQSFMLKFQKKADPVEAPAATEVEAPAPADAPLTKGDLLARITEIAQAREKEKADAAEKPVEEKKDAAPVPKGPRSTLKRLKLEFESEDRDEGDSKTEKPISETATVQPMEKQS